MQFNSLAEKAANQAVFELQFNSNDAVRFIQRNARVDVQTAVAAFQAAVTFHKQ